MAAAAHYRDRGPATYYSGDSGIAVLPAAGGRPDTFFPKPPCRASLACVSTVASWTANGANYLPWTPDGRALVALRGIYRKPPTSPYSSPDEIDVMSVPTSGAGVGKLLAPYALFAHLSPDGRLLTAYSIKRKSYGVYRIGRGWVRMLRHVFLEAWAPARR